MRISNKFLTYFDLAIIPITDRLIDRAKIDRRLEAEYELIKSSGIFKGEFHYYTSLVDVIHDRLSTLVSHLSIMIAVSMFVLTSIDGKIGKILLSAEVLLYIFLTVYTIRAIKSIGIQEDYEDIKSYMINLKKEISLKYAIAQSSLSLTVILTVFLFLFTLVGFIGASLASVDPTAIDCTLATK